MLMLDIFLEFVLALRFSHCMRRYGREWYEYSSMRCIIRNLRTFFSKELFSSTCLNDLQCMHGYMEMRFLHKLSGFFFFFFHEYKV